MLQAIWHDYAFYSIAHTFMNIVALMSLLHIKVRDKEITQTIKSEAFITSCPMDGMGWLEPHKNGNIKVKMEAGSPLDCASYILSLWGLYIGSHLVCLPSGQMYCVSSQQTSGWITKIKAVDQFFRQWEIHYKFVLNKNLVFFSFSMRHCIDLI